MNTVITEKHIKTGFSYKEYLELLEKLVEQEKTTGETQTPSLAEYTKLNLQRMKRWDKKIELGSELLNVIKSVKEKWYWIVLSEGWCGDAAQNIPLIANMVSKNSNIILKILLRDENPVVMDAYLTDGAKSIPKLIILKADGLAELGTWGPRPAIVQEMVMEHKKNPQMPQKEFYASIHNWYSKDKSVSMQKEFISLIEKWIEKSKSEEYSN